MSSVAVGQGSSATPLSNGNGAVQVVHFDATVRRKEKMRQKAVQGEATSTVVAVEATAPAAPAPVASAPVASAAPAPVAPAAVAAPVPSAAPAPEAAASPALKPAELEAFLVNFVVEQTGYPPEMVELDADLEADLGIDSIKKAQLFGEMAEQINVQIEINEEMSLDDFPTLRHVMDALAKATPGAAQQAAAPAAVQAAPAPAAPSPVAAVPAPVAPAPAAAQPVQPVQLAPTAVRPQTTAPQPVQVQPVAQAAPAAAPAPASATSAAAPAAGEKQSLDTLSAEELEKFLVNFVVEQTGYPPEMVELDADLEADLGIDSIKKAQMLGELAEQVNVQIQITDDMSLDDLPTLRNIVDLIVNGRN